MLESVLCVTPKTSSHNIAIVKNVSGNIIFKSFPNIHDGENQHRCKQVFTSVFDHKNQLDLTLGEKVLKIVEAD